MVHRKGRLLDGHYGGRLTTKMKNAFLDILLAEIEIGEEFGGDDAEGDAVAAVAEGCVEPIVAWRLADVGEAVLGFGKRAAPDVVGIGARARIDLGEPL